MWRNQVVEEKCSWVDVAELRSHFLIPGEVKAKHLQVVLGEKEKLGLEVLCKAKGEREFLAARESEVPGLFGIFQAISRIG